LPESVSAKSASSYLKTSLLILSCSRPKFFFVYFWALAADAANAHFPRDFLNGIWSRHSPLQLLQKKSFSTRNEGMTRSLSKK
jgi:hypothetical protein